MNTLIYLYSRTPIPVVVSELERDNEDEGQPDRNLQKNAAYHMLVGPKITKILRDGELS